MIKYILPAIIIFLIVLFWEKISEFIEKKFNIQIFLDIKFYIHLFLNKKFYIKTISEVSVRFIEG